MIKNTIVITMDQWRFDFLQANGFHHLKTPVMNKLVEKSTIFSRHYSVTSPCGPSRASLLTGLYQHSHRQVGNGTPMGYMETNLALELRKNNILPVLLGYTDYTSPPLNENFNDASYRTYSGVMPGFDPRLILDDELYPWLGHLRRNGIKIPPKQMNIFKPDQQSITDNPDWFYGRHKAIYPQNLSPTAFIIDHALDFLASDSAKLPFLLHATILHPHPPYIAPEPFNTMYRGADMPKPVRQSPQAEGKIHPYCDAQIKFKPNQMMMRLYEGNIRDMSDQDIQEMRAVYAGLVSEVDQELQRLLDGLKEQGLDQDTMIIITADHGDMLGDHCLQGKTGYWDEIYHIPLIIHNPQDPKSFGRTVNHFTESVDIVPTILAAHGLDIPRQCQGASLLELMGGITPANWREFVHIDFQWGDAKTSHVPKSLGKNFENSTINIIQNEFYKLVHFSDHEPLLFAIDKDPHCIENLAEDPAYQSIMLKLYRALMSFRNRTEDRRFSHLSAGDHESMLVADPNELSMVRPC